MGSATDQLVCGGKKVIASGVGKVPQTCYVGLGVRWALLSGCLPDAALA